MTIAGSIICWLLLVMAVYGADAGPRSSAVKSEFRKNNPCPATGKTRGACPGWEVDHRVALMCGGPDAVNNLQWLTIAEHRKKTRIERRRCAKARKAAPPDPAETAGHSQAA